MYNNYEHNNFELYLDSIKDYPVLDADIQIALVEKAQQGDEDAREQLIMSNLRFIILYVKPFSVKGVSFSELVSEGSLGLIWAIEKFDSSMNVTFISYAACWIRHYILRYIYKSRHLIRLPQNKIKLLEEVMRETQRQEFDGNKSKKEIEQSLEDIFGISSDYLAHLSNSSKSLLSLDNEIDTQEGTTTYLEMLEDENEESIDSKVEHNNYMDLINAYIGALNDREQAVIIKRYGLRGYKPYSLRELSEEFKVTKERIRQIEMKALQKLYRMKASDERSTYMSQTQFVA